MGQSKSQPIEALELPWTKYIPVKPTGKQLAFLLLPVKEALFGGAAGGGKSFCLLMGALQYVSDSSYASLILRRTYGDLSKPGALIDISKHWLGGTDAAWSEQTKTWRFPSGATLTFGYLDTANDKWQYQGGSYQFIGFDELTQFREGDYRYLFGWLRRKEGMVIPLRMRSASNPGGIGHTWVKQRFIDEANEDRMFLPARLDDNPYLDAETYRQSLAELDPITRAQILHGDWSARQAGNKFKREWFEIVDVAPVKCKVVRAWDCASTEPRRGGDPDWTVGLLMGITPTNMLYVIDIKRMRGTPGSVEAMIKQTAELDGKETPIVMEKEPGSSGVNMIDHYSRRVLIGWNFRGEASTGSKEVRANPVASQAEAGNIKLVRGPWINAFLDELEGFPQGAHDDIVDALSLAFIKLSMGAARRQVYSGIVRHGPKSM